MVDLMSINYRSSNRIILQILECILKKKTSQRRVLKTHIIQYANLKTTTAEKYLNSLENAEYIKRIEATWGKRYVIFYDITEKGIERYRWFSKLDEELDDLNE